MKTALVNIKGHMAISFSRRYDTKVPKAEGETANAYEQRTWRERLHYNSKTTEVFIPGIMFSNAIHWTAGLLGLKVEGRGNKRWSTIFRSGILTEPMIPLLATSNGEPHPVKRDDVQGETIYCNSRGRKGGSLDVERTFPVIPNWSCDATFHILDDQITRSIFQYHLEKAGKLCGLGRFAPRSGGFLGSFGVDSLIWQDEAEDMPDLRAA